MKAYTLRFLLRGAFFALICSVSAQDDQLIDVTSLAQLNAMRYDRDGNGTVDVLSGARTYASAFGTPSCPGGCQGYELTTDLDFNGSSWASSQGWEPIGSSRSEFFSTTFDGAGHTISNLFINRPNTNYVGLFGYISNGGRVINLGMLGGNVTGGGNVGAVVGYISSVSSAAPPAVMNCYATTNVTGKSFVGGIVGEGSSIRGCYATGAVTGTDSVGGLVGTITSSLAYCYATGNVISNGTISNYAGGLVGEVRTNPAFNTVPVTVIGCYATGNVNATTSGSDVFAGGLVGNARGSSSIDVEVRACYATGHATAGGTTSGEIVAGGFIGQLNEHVTLQACYSRGNATATGTGASASGFGAPGDGTITACYFDSDASNRFSTDAYAKTTAELQSPALYSCIYEGWSWATTGANSHYLWALCGSTEYPILYVDADGNGTPSLTEFGNQGNCSQAPPSPSSASTPPCNTDANGGNSNSGSNPPSSGNTPPSSGGNPPSSGNTPPSSGGNPPSSGGNPPSSGNNPGNGSNPGANNNGATDDLETSQAVQDTRIMALETSRAVQNSRMTSFETSQAVQDTKITSLETSRTAQNTKITSLETSRAVQNTKITSLETSRTAQNTKITELETKLRQLEATIGAAVGDNAGTSDANGAGGGTGSSGGSAGGDSGSSTEAQTTYYVSTGPLGGVEAYPNPATRVLRFANLVPEREYVYKVYTPSGALLRSGTVRGDEQVDITALSAGQYVLLLQDNEHEVLRTSLLVE